MRARP